MDYPKYFDPKKSQNLYGLEKSFFFLSSLFSTKKLPKVLMLSGVRGSGKSTLINHFLFSIFDEKNYNKNEFNLIKTSSFHNQFQNDIFQNIIYLKGLDHMSVKVDDIRNLKSKILQSSINNKERFIILDDIELFNTQSLNALLKIIEEPGKKNYFILINNLTKPLVDTIRSRSLELKVILSEQQRLEVINKLMMCHSIEAILKPEESKLSPGMFIKFNYIFKEYDISLRNDFLDNLSLLLSLYKKNKNTLFIDIAFYLTDFYFKDFKNENKLKSDNIYQIRTFVLKNLNKYLTFNLSQNSLLNAISNKLKHG